MCPGSLKIPHDVIKKLLIINIILQIILYFLIINNIILFLFLFIFIISPLRPRLNDNRVEWGMKNIFNRR